MSQVVEGRAKYAKQTGGRGQYGHVVLRVNVNGPELGITVVNALVGGVIPSRFVPAVEGGIRKAIASGILAVRGYRDARIEVIDGSFHDIDSSNLAFYIAAVMAMEDAVRQLPTRSDESDGDIATGVREPRVPREPSLTSGMALPEPEPD